MWERLEGRALRTFLAVVEEGNFSRAAERLGYVQSTVTTQVRQLEESAGRRLFDRLPRGVEPTESGRKLALYARRFLELGEELAAELQEEGEPKGTVCLRVLESFAAGYLWIPLRRFMERCPGIDLRVETGFQEETVEAVRSREAELGIVPRDPGRADLRFDPLRRDELVWAASPPLAALLDDRGYEGLAGCRVVGFGPRCLYTAEADALLAGHGTSVRARAEFGSLEMIREALRSGWGTAYMPRSTIEAELERGELAVAAGLGTRTLTHGLISSRQRELTRAGERLRSFLLECFPPS
ncbi:MULTISPECIES: LysR family transcriptional regulator [Paenibacillus]|uniref:LysR family transcriptional regulator n=1 Tax=Paenibacillus TaxID=44249 RepID=UPI0022B87475|nr:LysR family transcriptional regulator [Paenibacillus caseinilyticus]MCZ8523513.1 LysR family transcriptional regulator [Paenibacillus caseinilyticus]